MNIEFQKWFTDPPDPAVRSDVIVVRTSWKVGYMVPVEDEDQYTLDKEDIMSVQKLIGDGNASVSAGTTARVSKEVEFDQGRKAWVTVESTVQVRLTCDQDEDAINDAGLCAQTLAMDVGFSSLDSTYKKALKYGGSI